MSLPIFDDIEKVVYKAGNFLMYNFRHRLVAWISTHTWTTIHSTFPVLCIIASFHLICEPFQCTTINYFNVCFIWLHFTFFCLRHLFRHTFSWEYLVLILNFLWKKSEWRWLKWHPSLVARDYWKADKYFEDINYEYKDVWTKIGPVQTN